MEVEGVEIPNPTHFADLTGLGGGFLSALSTQVIGNLISTTVRSLPNTAMRYQVSSTCKYEMATIRSMNIHFS